MGRRPRPWRALLAGIGLGVITLTGRAQFSTTTEVVEVYATVSGQNGQPVAGLPADAFSIAEEGVSQPITVFAAGEIPLTMAVALDRSFSMRPDGLDIAKAGARRLVDLLRPSDRLLILTIGGGVETVAGFDTPRPAARSGLDRVSLWGSSPIGDIVVQAVEATAQQRGRRVVVVWSDGVEREAQRPRSEVLDRVRRADVLVYPVAIAVAPSPLLGELAALSGGRVVPARDRRAAERAATEIADELRRQYLLGYVRPAGAAGWRRIEVRVTRPGLRVRARQGYFAPSTAGASSDGPLASNQ